MRQSAEAEAPAPSTWPSRRADSPAPGRGCGPVKAPSAVSHGSNSSAANDRVNSGECAEGERERRDGAARDEGDAEHEQERYRPGTRGQCAAEQIGDGGRTGAAVQRRRHDDQQHRHRGEHSAGNRAREVRKANGGENHSAGEHHPRCDRPAAQRIRIRIRSYPDRRRHIDEDQQQHESHGDSDVVATQRFDGSCDRHADQGQDESERWSAPRSEPTVDDAEACDTELAARAAARGVRRSGTARAETQHGNEGP